MASISMCSSDVDPAFPEEVPGLFEGDIELQPGENPLVSTIVYIL